MENKNSLESKYKTPLRKLAEFFLKSRDKWRSRALENGKRIEFLKKKNRDLERSRNKWKELAKELKSDIEDNDNENGEVLEGELILKPSEAQKSKKLTAGDCRAKSHVYSLEIIMLGIQFIITAHNSLRGAMLVFSMLGEFFKIQMPSWVTIQNWLLRVGLYNLQASIENRTDWIFILDNTVQVGTKKALVILGVSRDHLKKVNFELKHTDVRVLDLLVSEKMNGDIIKRKIQDVSLQSGTPLQIVADKGPDVNRGINLFIEDNSKTIYTYDVTHKMANMLKKLLDNDSAWKAYQTSCAEVKKKTQQTNLAHLAPPNQRSKARYLNINLLVSWGKKIQTYKKNNNFTDIKPTYRISDEVIKEFRFMSKNNKTLLKNLNGNVYDDENKLISDVEKLLGPKYAKSISSKLVRISNTSRERFMEYFSWVDQYKSVIKRQEKIMLIVEITTKHLKNEGLHNQSAAECKYKIRKIKSRDESVNKFKEDVFQYLKKEGKGIKKEKALLATSDIIESVFGKYKLLDANSTMKGIGKMILSIPVFTTKMTLGTIKEAIESVTQYDLEIWINKFIGKSIPSQRNAAFKTANN